MLEWDSGLVIKDKLPGCKVQPSCKMPNMPMIPTFYANHTESSVQVMKIKQKR